MKTLTATELRTALKTAPHTKDGSGLPTRDQLSTALALVKHSNAHRAAASAWFCVSNDPKGADSTDVWALVCRAGVEPEDSAAWAAWHEDGSEGWEQAVFVARELHWAEACRLNELAHEQLSNGSPTDLAEQRKVAKQGTHWLAVQPGAEASEYRVVSFKKDRALLENVQNGNQFWANDKATAKLLDGDYRR